jgi:hypothetical protein
MEPEVDAMEVLSAEMLRRTPTTRPLLVERFKFNLPPSHSLLPLSSWQPVTVIPITPHGKEEQTHQHVIFA